MSLCCGRRTRRPSRRRQATSDDPSRLRLQLVIPSQAGLVASLAHQAGNVTGTVELSTSMVHGKGLELTARDGSPSPPIAMIMANVELSPAEPDAKEVHGAAQSLRHQLIIVGGRNRPRSRHSRNSRDRRKRTADALLVAGSHFIQHRRAHKHNRISYHMHALAGRSIDMQGFVREYVVAGRLMTYGISLPGQLSPARGDYVDKNSAWGEAAETSQSCSPLNSISSSI